MDAIEFVKERERMCKSFGTGCTGCPAFNVNGDGLCCTVSQESTLDATAQVLIVEKWSTEHPYKTRQSEFLKQFPYAECFNGIVIICPKVVDTSFSCALSVDENITCPDCRRKFWLQEVE